MIIESIIATLMLFIALSPRFSTRAYHPLIFQPHKHRGDKASFNALSSKYRVTHFHIPTGKFTKLHACLLEEETKRDILFFYCIGKDGDIATRTDILKLLLPLGDVFIYEPSGYGESSGRPCIKQLQEDALESFAFMTDCVHRADQKIFLFGESLGGAQAISLSNQFDVAGLILKSAFASLEEAAKDKYPLLSLYPGILFPQDFPNSKKQIKSARCPVLIIHGHQDRMVSHSQALRLYDAARNPKYMISLPDSRHAFMSEADKSTFQSSVGSFLASVSAGECFVVHQSIASMVCQADPKRLMVRK